MLILKGDDGKSRVIDILMTETNSICFVYNNYHLISEAIYVDCEEYSLNDFLGCISDEIEDAVIKDKHYDYLLIYTNQDKKNLQKIIDWLEEYKLEIPCRDIILTCR